MKRVGHAPSVTSLPQSPQDEATHRVRRYALTMGIRTVCFLAMVLIQPIGWWTWVLAAAAIFLPYVAVVYANAGSDSTSTNVESPVMQIENKPAATESDAGKTTGVFTIREQEHTADHDASDEGADGDADDDAPEDEAR